MIKVKTKEESNASISKKKTPLHAQFKKKREPFKYKYIKPFHIFK